MLKHILQIIWSISDSKGGTAGKETRCKVHNREKQEMFRRLPSFAYRLLLGSSLGMALSPCALQFSPSLSFSSFAALATLPSSSPLGRNKSKTPNNSQGENNSSCFLPLLLPPLWEVAAESEHTASLGESFDFQSDHLTLSASAYLKQLSPPSITEKKG